MTAAEMRLQIQRYLDGKPPAYVSDDNGFRWCHKCPVCGKRKDVEWMTWHLKTHTPADLRTCLATLWLGDPEPEPEPGYRFYATSARTTSGGSAYGVWRCQATTRP